MNKAAIAQLRSNFWFYLMYIFLLMSWVLYVTSGYVYITIIGSIVSGCMCYYESLNSKKWRDNL